MDRLSDRQRKGLVYGMIFLIPFLFFNKLSWLYGQMATNVPVWQRVFGCFKYIGRAFRNPLPSIHPKDLLTGGIAGLIFLVFFYIIVHMNKKVYRKGEEYGSARFGGPEDIAPYVDPDPEENVILTQTEGLMMSGRPKNPKFARNKNVLVIGGSGSGKTRFFVKPNLMQMHSSYVVTDPKGTVLVECGKMLARGKPKRAVKKDRKGNPKTDKNGKPIYLKKNGKYVYERDRNGKLIYEEPYAIKTLNTINFNKSMHYNRATCSPPKMRRTALFSFSSVN